MNAVAMSKAYVSKAISQPGRPYTFTFEVINCLWDMKMVFPEILFHDQSHTGFNDEIWFNLSPVNNVYTGRYCAVSRNLIDGSYEAQLSVRDLNGDCLYGGYPGKITGLLCGSFDARMVAELIKSEAIAHSGLI